MPARIVERPKISVLVPPPPPPPTELLRLPPAPHVVFAEPLESRCERSSEQDLQAKADEIAERIAKENMLRNQEIERADRKVKKEVKKIMVRMEEEAAARRRIDEEYRREVERDRERYWAVTRVSRTQSYHEGRSYHCASCGRRGHRAGECGGREYSYVVPAGRVRYLDPGL